MCKLILIVLSAVMPAGFALATVYHVPGQYSTIQTAVNVCGAGDTVMVAPGTYVENIQMREGVNLIGSGAENTIIDGGGAADVITAYQVNTVLIEGFAVQNSQQGGSSPGNIGVFLNPRSSAGTKIVRNCIVRNNGKGIDIWNDFGGTAYIEGNLIINNIYDGFDPYLGTVYLTNNTIAANGRCGYRDWSGGGAVYIKNNIIANNGQYGIYKHRDTPVFISYNDVHNNPSGNYMEGYSGPPVPFVPNPGTGEIQVNPLFAGGTPFDYHLTWANYPVPDSTKSPCIDSGDPALPLDPDSTRADMGCYYFDQGPAAPLVIRLTPHNPPIIVPAGGGSFGFTAALENTTISAINFDAWSEVILPNGAAYGPLIMRAGLTIPAGATISRVINQYVPMNAPSGDYSYVGKVGNYPDSVIHSSAFPFTKLAGDGAPNHHQGWSVYGWFGDDEFSTPDVCALLTAYPNPFNPSTVLSFELRDAGFVRLAVYDIAGREAASLVNGHLSSGRHEIAFKGGELASGMYFARLQAENVRRTVKLLFIK